MDRKRKREFSPIYSIIESTVADLAEKASCAILIPESGLATQVRNALQSLLVEKSF